MTGICVLTHPAILRLQRNHMQSHKTLRVHATYGIPYLQQVLGQLPSLSVIKALLVIAAQSVPGCGNPIVLITGFQDRQLTGQVQFIDNLGQPAVAAIGIPVPIQLADNAGNALFDNAGNALFS